MAQIKRPEPNFATQEGILRAEHFQMAYATNDIDRACEMFSARYNIKAFRRLDGPTPDGGYIRIELAWSGGLMYELMTATGPGSDFYVGKLAKDSFDIRHHHLGFLIHTEEQWVGLEEAANRMGRPLLLKTNNVGFLQKCFIDAPELGHYLEYVFPEPAGRAFLEGVPGF